MSENNNPVQSDYDPPYEQGINAFGDTPAGGSTDTHNDMTHDTGGLNPEDIADKEDQPSQGGASDTMSGSMEPASGRDSGNRSSDDGAVGRADGNSAVTQDGGIAIEGGSLPGNKDDFEGNLGGPGERQEPGAGDRANEGA